MPITESLRQVAAAVFKSQGRTIEEEKIKDELSHVEPVTKTDDGRWQLATADRRLSYGFSKAGDDYHFMLLVENKGDNWAMNEAKRMHDDMPSAFGVEVVGQAYSTPHQDPVAFDDQAQLVPGLSVGHIQGWPGSLGAIVEFEDDGANTGILSAAHVLSRNNLARSGGDEIIIYPAWPDHGRTALNRVGLLHNYTYLSYYQDESSPYNTADVALVKLDRDRPILGNFVPDPQDPHGSKKIRLTGVKPADEMWQYLAEPVFKIGRTTGFTSGTLDVVNIVGQAITIGDMTYIYNDIAAVRKAQGSEPFSQPGDSGSLVYASDGTALGLIIGGSQEFTFICPLETCLDAIGARLISA